MNPEQITRRGLLMAGGGAVLARGSAAQNKKAARSTLRRAHSASEGERLRERAHAGPPPGL